MEHRELQGQPNVNHAALVVPGIAKEVPQPLTVRALEPGETVNTLATLYAVDPKLIFTLNEIDDATTIPAGTVLTLPVPPPPPETLPCGDLLAPLDKTRALRWDCEPQALTALPIAYSYGGTQELHPEAAAALVGMFEDAASQGHDLVVRSAYRSYAEQEKTFQFWVDQLGFEKASRVSAEAGHSEHQLGTAADITNAAAAYDLTEAFADTAGGQWLAAHAEDYGFVMSYPEGAHDVTGYAFEPWHFRYVGPETASEVAASGRTLNEYLVSAWLPGRYLIGGELQ